MDNKQIEQIIRSYLPQIVHMSLATVGADGRPWVCEVHYSFDDELNLYWGSVQTTRHSREVLANGHVAGNIVTQHHLDQQVRAVSFEGTAEMLQGITDQHPAYQAFARRFPVQAGHLLEAYTRDDETSARLYKITVNDYYLTDGYGKPGWPEKHHLTWKAEAK